MDTLCTWPTQCTLTFPGLREAVSWSMWMDTILDPCLSCACLHSLWLVRDGGVCSHPEDYCYCFSHSETLNWQTHSVKKTFERPQVLVVIYCLFGHLQRASAPLAFSLSCMRSYEHSFRHYLSVSLFLVRVSDSHYNIPHPLFFTPLNAFSSKISAVQHCFLASLFISSPSVSR